MKFKCRNFTLDFSKRTHIMAILNVTPDSFSDGGKYFSCDKAVKKAIEMVKDGADIIDIGGESTRPGSDPVSVQDEIKRVLPVIKKLVKEINVPISIDTHKPEVVKACLSAGAHIVNDITGLTSGGKLAKLAAGFGAGIIIMHMKGKPKTMQTNPSYRNLISEITGFLKNGIKTALKAGISKEKIIIDPGIGFGKTVRHNLEIINKLYHFEKLGLPILVGPSRKSFIGKILNLPAVGERLEGTLASVAIAVYNGANIIRVHDVKENLRLIRIVDSIKLENTS